MESKVDVIEAGPWIFDNRTLIEPWTDDAIMEREDMVEFHV